MQRSPDLTTPDSEEPTDCHTDSTPEAQLGRALFRVVRGTMFDETPNEEFEALPLAQLRLFWTVYSLSDGTMKDCSERLRVSQSTVTQLADKLVKRSLIERQTDPQDRRIVRLCLSPHGRELCNAANERRREVLRSALTRLTPHFAEQFLAGLEQFVEVVEALHTERGNPLPPLNDDLQEARPLQNAQNVSSEQPVVDLLSRRVRGQ